MSRVQKILKGVAESDRVAGAYLFVGSPGVGKREAAEAFAELLELESDPTIHQYDNARGRRLDVDALLRSQPQGTHVYVCGPEKLMNAVIETALGLGWPKSDIHFERFGAPKPAGEVPFEVICQRSGKKITVGSEETLLEAPILPE